MNTGIKWPEAFLLAIFFSLAAMSAQAKTDPVNSELGQVSIDGIWEFPGCFEPEEPGETDQREFLVFDDNTVESRVIFYASTNGMCEGEETTESEVFPFEVLGYFQSEGWGEDGSELAPICQDPNDCTGNGGRLNAAPVVTEVKYVLSPDGSEFEIDRLYIDDTGENWYMYRDAGEDDEPSPYMSTEEPLVKMSPSAVPVTIDIKPGSDSNPVNPRSKGVIPLAVLGSAEFDATQIDFSTVGFGVAGASTVHDGHVEDVDADGFMDMVFHFRTRETGIVCGDSAATLNGETHGGIPFTGTDAVNTVGCQ